MSKWMRESLRIFIDILQQLAGNSCRVGNDLVKGIWLNRLPHLINIALIPQKEDDNEKLRNISDKHFRSHTR